MCSPGGASPAVPAVLYQGLARMSCDLAPVRSLGRRLHAAGAVEVAIALVVILPGVTRFSQLCTVAAGGLGAIALLGLFRPAIAAGAGIAGVDLVLVALAAFAVWSRLAK